MTDSLFIYRASELGGCEKALIAKRIGYEPDRSVYTKGNNRIGLIMEEGNLHEDAIIAKYKEAGDDITLQQYECNLRLGIEGVIIQGHLDGVISRPSIPGWRSRVLEIKTMGDASFKEFAKKGLDTPGLVQKYKWQISCYMHAMEREALLVVKNRNTGQIIETPIDVPFYTFQEIRERVDYIESVAATGELPFQCSVPQFPCPFHYLHESDEEVSLVVDTAIDAFAKVYKEAKAEEERAKAKAKVARDRLRALSNGKTVETPNAKLTFYTMKKKHVDYEQMISDYNIDVSKYEFTKESEPILRISEKKREEEDASGNDAQGTTEPSGQGNLFAGSE